MTREIEDYLMAMKSLKLAREAVDDITKRIDEFSAVMRDHRLNFMRFSLNLDVKLTESDEASRKGDYDLEDFPTGDEIATALSDAVDAYKAVHEAWGKVAEEDRVGLKTPSNDVFPSAFHGPSIVVSLGGLSWVGACDDESDD